MDERTLQGVSPTASANTQGSNAFLVGSNGPAYINNATTGGTVAQNGNAVQDGQQSATQLAKKE